MSSESESVMANIGPNIGERRNVVIAMDGSDYAEGAFNCTVTLLSNISPISILYGGLNVTSRQMLFLTA